MLRSLPFLLIAFLAVSSASAQDIRPSLMPNPADRQVTVQINAVPGGPVKVEIFSVLGHRIADYQILNPLNPVLTLQTSEWQSGIYLVRITCNGHTDVKRLKVQHN